MYTVVNVFCLLCELAFSQVVPFTLTASILMFKVGDRPKTCREGQRRVSIPPPITCAGVPSLTDSSRIDVVDPKLGAPSPTLEGSRPLKSKRTWRTLIGLPGIMERAWPPEP